MKIEKGHHGYLVLPRQTKLLQQELGCDLFGFYICLVMEAKWDRRYKNFGLVNMTQAELANKFNMNQGTISRKFKKLEQHKYFIIRHKGDMRLGFFPLFLTDVAPKMHSENYANLHELYADMHKINADLQDNRTHNTPQRLYVSSNTFTSNDGVEEARNDVIDINEVDEGIQSMEEQKNG